jgi:hypothetical protein
METALHQDVQAFVVELGVEAAARVRQVARPPTPKVLDYFGDEIQEN